MNERLEVEITAEIDDFKRGLSESERAAQVFQGKINRLNKELKDATIIASGYGRAHEELSQELKQGAISQKQYQAGLNRLQRDEKETNVVIKNLRQELAGLNRTQRDLGAQTGKTGAAIGKMGKETSVNAVPAMTSFSQVMQDAPYGIQGVANNITQLTSQFGYLSKNAGGAGAALKAMASSLMGPAGILLGVSLVTSAFVAYGDKIMDAVSSTNKLKEATQSYVGEAMSEISNLRVLIGVANNHEASIVARRKAIDKINDKYSDYLGNLDLDKLKTNETRAAVDNLTRSLIQQAQVRGIQDVIGEEMSKAGESITDLRLQHEQFYRQAESELKRLNGIGYWGNVIDDSKSVIDNINNLKRLGLWDEPALASLRTASGGLQSVAKGIRNVEKSAADAIKPYQDIQQALQEQIFSVTAVPEFSQDAVKITGKGSKSDPVKVAAKFDFEAENLLSPDEISDLTNQINNDLRLGETLNVAQLEYAMNRAEDNFFFEIQEEAKDAADEINKSTAQIDRAFEGMISGMVNSLIQGEFKVEDFVKNIMSSLASIAITSMFTGGIGGIFGGMFSQGGMVPKTGYAGTFATGGMVGGGSYTGDRILARLNSGEGVLTAKGVRNAGAMMQSSAVQQIEVAVRGEISGDTINLVADRASKKQNRVS